MDHLIQKTELHKLEKINAYYNFTKDGIEDKNKIDLVRFTYNSKKISFLNIDLPQVEHALFTQHINNLTEHIKINKKDFQSRKGLLAFVIKRKRLLIYLKNTNNERYERLIKKLKLREV